MSNRPRRRRPDGDHTDPRRLGGSITGPGGPHDHNAVIVDARNALLLGSLQVATVTMAHGPDETTQGVYLLASGRVNRTTDRADIAIITDLDGAAGIVSELLALAYRAGPQLLEALAARLVALDAEGHGSVVWLQAALDLAQGQEGPDRD